MKGELDAYFRILEKFVLRAQSPTTGLIGDGKVGYVRDTIYSAGALWILSIGYRSIDADNGKQFELEQSAVKSMRAILTCFMRQSDKLELYKSNPIPENAIHIRYDFKTGDVITDDDDNSNHSYNLKQQLQLDAIAVYLIFLCEMISSGLEIIFSLHEVAFIQNLVYYIERAYRTPDFGMWGRGSKHNCGKPELSSSSVGSVKAALTAIDGFNLYGNNGANWSTIYVDPDAFSRNQRTLEALLPRESNSKFTDASLLPTLLWPCFAANRNNKKTVDALSRINSLSRKNGHIRFNKDGFGSTIEDISRYHYLPAELKKFEGRESEWPVFNAFLLIDAKFRGNQAEVDKHHKLLRNSLQLDPELNIQIKIPTYIQINENSSLNNVFLCNFQWVQSVTLIALMLADNLIPISLIDPRNLFEQSLRTDSDERISERIIQISLISENPSLQTFLSSYGVESETPAQCEPIVIWPTQDLVKIYSTMGVEPKLGLSGRPSRPIGVMGSSRVYRILGRTIVAYPLVFDVSDFYMSSDTDSLIDNVWFSLDFLKRYFDHEKAPVFLFILREDLCKGPRLRPLLEVLSEFRRGSWRGIKIRLGRLQSFVANSNPVNLSFVRNKIQINNSSGWIETGLCKRSPSLSSLQSTYTTNEDDYTVDKDKISLIVSCNDASKLVELYLESSSYIEKSQILIKLCQIKGKDFDLGGQKKVGDKLNFVLRQFTKQKDWVNVRLVASHCRKLVDSLAPSVTTILCEGKQLSIGVFGHEEVTVSSPLSPAEISNLLYTIVYPVDPSEAVLQQEIILTIGQRILVTHPNLLKQILNVRIGWLIEAMRLELSNREGPTVNILSLSPSEIKALLEEILTSSNRDDLGAFRRRQLEGVLNKAPSDLYHNVWLLFERSSGGIRIANRILPAEPTLSDMDSTDIGFKLLIENTLRDIKSPEHRHLVIETITIIATVLKRNPELKFNRLADIDLIIEDGIYDYSRGEDNLKTFYSLESPKIIKYISHSVIKSLLLSGDITPNDNCKIS